MGRAKVYSVGTNTITFDSYYLNKNTNLDIEANNYSAFIVYPNPASHCIQIKSLFNFEKTTIEIFDITGRKYLVDKYFGDNSLKININDLTTGLYMIKLYSIDKLYVYKFLKA